MVERKARAVIGPPGTVTKRRKDVPLRTTHPISRSSALI
jgi:hypothetical protein